MVAHRWSSFKWYGTDRRRSHNWLLSVASQRRYGAVTREGVGGDRTIRKDRWGRTKPGLPDGVAVGVPNRLAS